MISAKFRKSPAVYAVVILALILVASSVGANFTALAQEAAGPMVWVEDGMTRVFKDDPAKVNSNITLYTAKNEYEPFQIVLQAPASNGLTNVNVTISDLTGPNGALIGSDNITLYRQHYLYVTQGSKADNATTNVPLGPGWYPDALIPFTDPVTHQDLTGQLDAAPFDLAAGENQPIWVDIYTPLDVPAGTYHATATITSDQGTSIADISLNVWDFALPQKRSLRGFTNTVQSLRTRTTAIELLRHGLSPKIVDRADERFLIDNYGLDMVHVFRSGGAAYGNCQTDPAPAVSDVLAATADHEPELYLYTSYANEVWQCTDLYPEFLAWASSLRLGGSHPMLVTYPVDGLMGPDLDHTAADIWSVLPKHYDQAKTNIELLVDHPHTQVWSYNPLVQDGYSPKFTIDFPPINARIMQGFINQSLGLNGTKFWRVDNWTDDPWNNAEASRADAPGEGHMVYPGENVGLPGQIVSGARMKWFREGSEDYEYVQILRGLGQEQFALDTIRTVAVDFHTWSQDKDALYATRQLLGDRIHSLSSTLPPSVDAGLDQTIALADSALLVGAVGDDGLPDPPAALTATWSQLSGPGTVTFGNRSETLTTATFSATGTYLLRLTVNDGYRTSSDDVSITVNAAPPNTIRVPQDYPTIQAGINAAQAGDLVLVSPGTYVENLYVPRTLTLASTYYTTGDEALVDQTVISSPLSDTATIIVSSSAGAETQIVGFTIRDGQDGIKISGKAKILHNHLVDLLTDAVDFSSDAVGLVQDNVMENNGDDGVDIDHATVLIRGNLVQTNAGDGVEIRALTNNGPILVIIIRDNVIVANAKDGIQLIDDDTIADTAALLIIDRNLIANNGQAGLGLMDNGTSSEDYRAASLLERIHLFNNTFVGNDYGVTGGDNLIALNNIFVGHINVAVKQIDGDSVGSYNLFWNNGTDDQGSNLDLGTTFFADPSLDAEYRLQHGSPAIDAGTAMFTLPSGETALDLRPGEYFGVAPDLGEYESNYGASGNFPPVVNAGPDQFITWPISSVNLAGTVTDDGNPDPPGVTTVTWSQVSGPPGVVFGNPNHLETTATFPDAGVYELRLTASDSELASSNELVVTVIDPTLGSVDVRVAASSDDAEESASGGVGLESSDLELVLESSVQIVGLRFNGITVPPDSAIIKAHVQFQTDEVNSEATDLTIEGEASDNVATFVSSGSNISSRPRTVASAAWSPAPWTTRGEAGPDQQTPDISPIIQEIVTRPGWSSGNALVLIISGSGKRVSESYDGDQAGAPLLHVEYSITGDLPPQVTIGAPVHGSTFIEGDAITFSGTASDFEDGESTASLTWESSLNGLIGAGGLFTTTLTTGLHSITATLTDNQGLAGSAEVNIAVLARTPVLVGAGDIAGCDSHKDEETAALLDNIAGTVFTLGDNVYPDGTPIDFRGCYDPTWGRHKARTRPAPGNHDYHTPGASGYFDYFGAAAGEVGKGYYSYDIGDWHIIVLNSDCGAVGGCDGASPQGQWLQADLAANPSTCTLAYWHRPLFASDSHHGNNPAMQDFWSLLYEAGADVVLNGHSHNYERFAPQDPYGAADGLRGIREFVVGTGGAGLYSFGDTQPNSEIRESKTHGVLRLTLHPTSYDWEFIPITGQTFTDSGSTYCVRTSPAN